MSKFGDTMAALGSSGTTEEATYIAGEYDGISTGPRMLYSFETQEGVPVDGSSKMPRNLSPFTIRLVPPSTGDLPPEFITGETSDMDVNMIGSANQAVAYSNMAAREVLGAFGINSVSDSSTIANTLQQQVSQGQVLNTASGTQIRTTLTDSTTAMDIAAQVARILATPPLTLLINPEEMSISYQGVQNYAERGREGFIFQRWGETQPSIKFSGSTGAFIAGEDLGTGLKASIPSLGAIHSQMNGETTTPTGVQFASKRNSAAFQNFQTLFMFYKSNGYIYDSVTQTEAHLMIGAVAIDYDQWTYVGHIESFEYSYDAESPHRIQWSMEFIVDARYDLAEPTYAVLPLESPIPNPTDPGGGGSNSTGTRGTTAGGWWSITGTETEAGGIDWDGFGDFGSPPFDVTWGYGDQVTVTNPDGTPRNS